MNPGSGPHFLFLKTPQPRDIQGNRSCVTTNIPLIVITGQNFDVSFFSHNKSTLVNSLTPLTVYEPSLMGSKPPQLSLKLAYLCHGVHLFYQHSHYKTNKSVINSSI